MMYDIKPRMDNAWFESRVYSKYYMPSSDFIVSNKPVDYLTQVFCHSYERPREEDIRMGERLDAANYWDQYLR